MATLTVSFPDTAEMRAVLHQLCGHALDDNMPAHESEAEEAEASGEEVKATQERAMAAAWETFAEAVTSTLTEGFSL